MISALHLIWILPLSTLLGFVWAAWLAGGKEKTMVQSPTSAMKRLGEFGKLFMDYDGCPRGAMGRACMPIEEEVLLMPPITDVDGGVWIPVNAEALNALVSEYIQLKNERRKENGT